MYFRVHLFHRNNMKVLGIEFVCSSTTSNTCWIFSLPQKQHCAWHRVCTKNIQIFFFLLFSSLFFSSMVSTWSWSCLAQFAPCTEALRFFSSVFTKTFWSCCFCVCVCVCVFLPQKQLEGAWQWYRLHPYTHKNWSFSLPFFFFLFI